MRKKLLKRVPKVVCKIPKTLVTSRVRRTFILWYDARFGITSNRNWSCVMILAQKYLARYETPFAAYMALQRALMMLYLSRGGNEREWCERIAPLFHRRYQKMLLN